MTRQRLLVIGWREWITLSGLACPIPIKAKIDTEHYEPNDWFH